MASSPNREEEEYDEDEDEDEDEEDEDSDEEDEEYDSEAEPLNAAVAVSLEEAEVAVEDSPEVEIIEAAPNQEDRDRENEEEEEEELEEDDEEEKGKREVGELEFDRAASWPNCTICLDPWTSDGPHRVCCIPCGHVYGKSCLEKWLQCRKSAGKCPQCNWKFKLKEIINLYPPLIVVPNDDLEKEVRSLREDNEILKLENSRLQEEVMQKHTDIARGIMQLREQRLQDQEWMRQMTQHMAQQMADLHASAQQFSPTQQLSSQTPFLSFYPPSQYAPLQYLTPGSYQPPPLTQPSFSYSQEDYESFRQFMAWRTRPQGDESGGSH